jgi:agmatinase
MADYSKFDANCAGNPNNNIFGLPFSEEESELVILPVPWEVTVSFGAGTSRAAEHIFKASLQVDLYDSENPDGWKKGFFMRPIDKKILLKSDFLRKEAELYIDFISKGEAVSGNKFMTKSLKEINEGSQILNNWVYLQTKQLLDAGKKVGLLGGDHSTPLGFWKAIGEKHGDFGILQVDAHYDLRIAYEDFVYSHASIIYNSTREIDTLKKVVQIGVRDFSKAEKEYAENSNGRILTYFYEQLKNRQFEGESWKSICDEVISQLPQKVHISFDIDGLDPKLCPHTGTPVQGGFETYEINYLLSRLKKSGREIVGFDLVEVGVDELEWDANVGARELWKLCNLLVS